MNLHLVNSGSSPAFAATEATAGAPPVIETCALELRFGGKRALAGLDLRIARGGIHAIVGANGAGKSSLFRILLGFQAPTAGSARILGCDCAELRVQDRARIGFVNEEHSLPAWLRVAEVVAMQRGLYPNWDEARYREVAGHFNVDPAQRVRELSRGERAGINLAMALAQRPELLILDEPTLGLDVVAKRAFLEIVLAGAADEHCTVVYCSHQMEEIERLADNLVLLERGQLLHTSPPDELCARVSLWVAEMPFVDGGAAQFEGVLQTQRIDGLFHYLVLDRGEDFEHALRAAGARRVLRGPVGLDRAINAFLARGHAAPVAAEVQP